MTKYLGKGTKKQLKCCGCEGNHLYKYYTQMGYRMRTVHNLHEVGTLEDVSRNIPRIYSSLNNRLVYHQPNMIEVEGKIANEYIAILICSRENQSYISPILVEIFHLNKSNHDRSWMVHLDIGTKRKINELLVKGL